MKSIFYLIGMVLFSTLALADVSLPKIFSSNMVLQRNVPVTVWGWAAKGETVTVGILNQTIKVKADNNGRWKLALKPMEAGGPYELKVSGKNKITLNNVLIGDVWVGSGQSNMEWIVKNSNNPDEEVPAANYTKIRLFTVTKKTSYAPEEDLAGGEWLECTPKNIGDFSAVAYFFGRKLTQEVDIPIGLINSSWGGTNIQTWISWDVMGQKDQYKNTDLEKLRSSTKDLAERQKKYEAAMKNEPGSTENWQSLTDYSSWKQMSLPQLWENAAIGNADGYVWFQKEFEVTEPLDESLEMVLSLGPIDDADITYLNGEKIGAMNAYNAPRVYKLKPGMVRPGKNSIVIRVLDTGGGGGIYGKPDQMFFQHGENKIFLSGDWNYKTAVVTTDFGIQNTGPNSFPSQLYNGMIHPIIQFPITGVIWYQGESNTWEAYRYRTLFKELITDWRTKWKKEVSFLWAQLANFLPEDSLPKQSEWAELREAQTMTLAMPKTGQAILIDIGERDDIHPRNKQDVGLRLALAALKTTYGKNLVYSGPTFKSMQKDGNRIVISFDNTGAGLLFKDKYGYGKSFAVAGNDQKFYWARAELQGDKVIVSSDQVKDPVAVRYAWANNPDDANLYNKEGLPATPFRTDTWPGISQGEK